ncbi:hypothetical protein HYV81_00480 [Candidatus Woesearchaeota archaeon]|nr:hypothetical protein [Candidatus Woesearchaeota archaeon]
MQGLAVTHKGMEDIAAQEIKELIGANAEIREQAVLFTIKKLEELALLCYKAQSVIRVMLLLAETASINELGTALEHTDIKEWLHNKSFAVRCLKQELDEPTPEIEGRIGEIALNEVKKRKIKAKVSLKEPDVTLFCYITKNACFLGIDFAGFDLSKRYYKIFQHPDTLKGTIAYGLVRLSGYKPGEILVDPFSGSGIIPIEAACFAYKYPVQYYSKDRFAFLKFTRFDFSRIDKEIQKPAKATIFGLDHNVRYVEVAKKNATVAGINKYVSFSRVAVEWHDTKLKEHSVDVLVGNPPSSSKLVAVKDIKKLYDELFYQADFVISDNGRIVLASRDAELAIASAVKHGFKAVLQRDIYMGQQMLKVILFERA